MKIDEHKLSEGTKGMEEKRWLAWVLRRNTMASRTWIAGRLNMGVEPRVSRAVSEVQKDNALKRRLIKSLLTD